jgi:hypothetical protein
MGRCRVVQPELVRLRLSGDDYIDVQKELNAGDYFDLLVAMADRKPFAKILAYLVGWSLVGLDEQPLPYSLELPENVRRDTIRSLDKGTYSELSSVINRHERAEEAAADAKKKTPAPALALSSS